MSAKITIAVQCHNFQRRFCWMLSSLAQQTRRDLVVVDVDHVRGNGRPSTEELAALFRPWIAVEATAWPDTAEFQYRGLVRNRQLKACRTEWLMFADCDMVYHPDYFRRLLAELESRHPTATYMLSSGRTSNPIEDANSLVTGMVCHKAREVPEAFELADSLDKIPRGNVGAGFCQVVNHRLCPHGGYYVQAGENKDWGWKRGSNPKSDKQFRRRVSDAGGPRLALPEWFSKNAIHLNHHRDPDAGRHLEDQR